MMSKNKPGTIKEIVDEIFADGKAKGDGENFKQNRINRKID